MIRKTNKRINKHRKQHTLKHGKRWITAIAAAKKTLRTTGSLKQANKSLKRQALLNARKLFGSVGQVL
jgi:hypothetical protein